MIGIGRDGILYYICKRYPSYKNRGLWLAVAEKNRVLLIDDEPGVVYLVKKSLANVKDKFYNSPDKFLFISKPISIPEMTRQIKQFFG